MMFSMNAIIWNSDNGTVRKCDAMLYRDIIPVSSIMDWVVCVCLLEKCKQLSEEDNQKIYKSTSCFSVKWNKIAITLILYHSNLV